MPTTKEHYESKWASGDLVHTVFFKKAKDPLTAQEALLVGTAFAKLSASVDCGATLVGAGTGITDDVDTPAETVTHFGSTLKMLGSIFMHANEIAPLLPKSFLALTSTKDLQEALKAAKSKSMKDIVKQAKGFEDGARRAWEEMLNFKPTPDPKPKPEIPKR